MNGCYPTCCCFQQQVKHKHQAPSGIYHMLHSLTVGHTCFLLLAVPSTTAASSAKLHCLPAALLHCSLLKMPEQPSGNNINCNSTLELEQQVLHRPRCIGSLHTTGCVTPADYATPACTYSGYDSAVSCTAPSFCSRLDSKPLTCPSWLQRHCTSFRCNHRHHPTTT
jgi:hypothetical protein